MLDVYDQVHTEEITPMALSDSALSELLDALRVGDGTDLVRELAQWALQQLIDAEAAQAIGAGRYERSDDRVTHRNGTRTRTLSTKPGTWPWGSRSCARVRSSPSCWSPAAGSTRRSTR
jgi:hypothetical protein